MKIALALLWSLAAAPAFAQNVGISASVDRNSVELNDQIVLTVTINSPQSDVPEPQLPSMPNFSVYSSGRSQNIAIINGRMSGSIMNTYVLQPRFVGKTTIGPISVVVGGKRYETQPIDIQIVRPSQQPVPHGSNTQAPLRAVPGQPETNGGAPGVFITAELDKKKAYVNEQVTLRVRFYTSVPLLGNPQYTTPPTEGFLTEDLPPERHGQAQYKGRIFHYSEIKTALFPAKSGKLTIGPAVIHCQVQSDAAMDPFESDFFQKFFAQGMLQGQTQELKTDPLTITVMPLPDESKPDSFTGAVGQFHIDAAVDKKSLRVGEALALNVTVEGRGDLKALGAPKLPALGDFRLYDTLSSSNLRKANDIVEGSKSFKTVLVPRASGRLTIPAIPFSYFDPNKQQYVRIQTSPIELQVQASAGGKPSVSYVGSAGPSELTTLNEDIRFVKDVETLSWPSRLLTAVSRQGYALWMPLVLFIFAAGFNYRRERINLDPAGMRFRGAASAAKRKIAEAEKNLDGNLSQTATSLFDALAGFLADKLNCAAYGLTLREATEMIQSRFPKIPPERIGELKSIWDDLDLFRFAGSKAANRESMLAASAKLQALLKQLDQEMRK